MNDRKYDLQERLIDFAVLSIDVTEALPSTRAGNHVAGQLLRSATSPAPNYAEARAAESQNDFVHKMKVSLKELRETDVWLEIIRRKGYLSGSQHLTKALDECDQLTAIFVKSIETAKAKARSSEVRDGAPPAEYAPPSDF